ncbi:metallophosphoesterase [Chryseobacterium camelliae]|uniref:metallophosphoesterase n=1 Tax=Chryseobacterium camelliae TaxID=1265445 RepID=UPI002FDE39C8
MMTRKDFLKRIFQLSVIGAFPALYSWQVEPFWVEFVQRKLSVKNLPAELEGKILMQISDLHVGDRFDYHFLIGSFQKAKQFEPDFVVYTGDYVNHGSTEDHEKLKKVMSNAVMGKLGTFGILGNHDYGKKWKDLGSSEITCRILENHGITMLNNAQEESHGLNFIGFDDLWSPNFDPMSVMKDYDASKANIVLVIIPMFVIKRYGTVIKAGF